VERVYVVPPGSRLGPITPQERQALMAGSLVAGVYDKAVDRASAYEALKERAAASADVAQDMAGKADRAATGEGSGGLLGGLSDLLFGSTGPRGGRREGLAQAAAKSAVRTIGSSVGREIVRGVLGGILGGGTRRRR
jgi:DNA helicase HerA-like ATPase